MLNVFCTAMQCVRFLHARFLLPGIQFAILEQISLSHITDIFSSSGLVRMQQQQLPMRMQQPGQPMQQSMRMPQPGQPQVRMQVPQQQQQMRMQQQPAQQQQPGQMRLQSPQTPGTPSPNGFEPPQQIVGLQNRFSTPNSPFPTSVPNR